MSNERITKELSWKELKETFKIGTVRYNGKLVQVNELEEAIQAGEVRDMLQKCADELHAGDFASAVKAFRRTLQSQGSNMRNDKIAHTTTDLARYELLDSYTKQFVASANTTIVGKAKWQYTVEDIEALRGNHEELRKLYNSMMDKKSKQPEDILNVTTMEEYMTRVDMVRNMRNEASQPSVSTDLLDKLKANKKLSAEEAAELVKLLSK